MYVYIEKNEISNLCLSSINMSKLKSDYQDGIYNCCKEGGQLVSTKQVEILIYSNYM